MVKLSYCHILPLLCTVALVPVLYISWADVSQKKCLSELKFDFRLWRSEFSTAPPSTTDPPGLTPVPLLHLADYHRMPQWDFDDVYRTERRSHKISQKCDNSLWTRIQEEPELKDKFIPNIRMYVYNGSISMSEWNRLSHFNNPFGFMNYTHQDVMSALNLVQKPKEPLLPPKPGRDCISCAVVGTGGILWRSKKGAEIDQHDYVFRVNGAVIKGFEEDVGNRTDVYVHTSYSITQAEIRFRKYNYTRAPHDQGIKYVLIPEGRRDYEWLSGLYKRERRTAGYFKNWRPWTQYSGRFNESNFYVLHMDFLRYVRNRFLKSHTLQSKRWALVRPTTGAFMMFVALHLCDQVDAYGFITDDYKQYSNYYYERGAKTRVVFYINHNYDQERALWRRLHDLGVIHLYMGEPRKHEPMQHPPKAAQ
ncbi:alpha-N-acetylgalactosaminide alpha-2,6-sialyltransferase 1-like [Boleophthalmus pectinirostris]|uniref:alpha-N-acetylgalactosaminide alpha-2,6-sialyltransferase 1-like n=1 Tax=Boleophthalmus pectinirostris TaxID=150288 RepID=UPI00242C7470|nr:alpha-N-acetylgalactosaminide alpha-2,6-sialyltransferase 1-like [Boleophthalmus pectinirostris]